MATRDQILRAVRDADAAHPFPHVQGFSTAGTAAMLAACLCDFDVDTAGAVRFAREIGEAIHGSAVEILLETPYGPATIEDDGDRLVLSVSDDEVAARATDAEQLRRDAQTLRTA